MDVLTATGRPGNLPGSGSDPRIPVLRVNQLDAFELDASLEQLVWGQFAQCFRGCRPGLLSPVEPELKALLALLLWRFTLYPDSATVGQALLSLRYHDTTAAAAAITSASSSSSSSSSPASGYRPLTPGQKLGLALFTVGPRWLRERSHSLLLALGLSSGPAGGGGGGGGVGGGGEGGGDGGTPATDDGGGPLRRGLRLSLTLLSAAAQIAGLLNFLVFLRDGRHPSLAERAVGARAVFSRPGAGRDLGYRHTNRELLWHGFAEFLIFLLPLVDVRRAKAAFRSLAPPGGAAGRPGTEADGAAAAAAAWRECGFCGEWPTMPHTVGCGHVFCYYCVKSHAVADAYLACPRCGAAAGLPEPVDLEVETETR